MRTHRFQLQVGGALTLALLSSGCTGLDSPDIEAQLVEGAWVFTYAEEPELNMDALLSGQAALEGDCLEVGGMIVVWYDHHLESVGEVITRVQDGETIEVRLGGGSVSPEGGDPGDDFPAEMAEHCSAAPVWHSAVEALTIEEAG